MHAVAFKDLRTLGLVLANYTTELLELSLSHWSLLYLPNRKAWLAMRLDLYD